MKSSGFSASAAPNFQVQQHFVARPNDPKQQGSFFTRESEPSPHTKDDFANDADMVSRSFQSRLSSAQCAAIREEVTQNLMRFLTCNHRVSPDQLRHEADQLAGYYLIPKSEVPTIVHETLSRVAFGADPYFVQKKLPQCLSVDWELPAFQTVAQRSVNHCLNPRALAALYHAKRDFANGTAGSARNIVPCVRLMAYVEPQDQELVSVMLSRPAGYVYELGTPPPEFNSAMAHTSSDAQVPLWSPFQERKNAVDAMRRVIAAQEQAFGRLAASMQWSQTSSAAAHAASSERPSTTAAIAHHPAEPEPLRIPDDAEDLPSFFVNLHVNDKVPPSASLPQTPAVLHQTTEAENKDGLKRSAPMDTETNLSTSKRLHWEHAFAQLHLEEDPTQTMGQKATPVDQAMGGTSASMATPPSPVAWGMQPHLLDSASSWPLSGSQFAQSPPYVPPHLSLPPLELPAWLHVGSPIIVPASDPVPTTPPD